MSMAKKTAGVLLGATALCGVGAGIALADAPGQGAGAGTAPHAAVASGDYAPMYSRGFHIYNLTSTPMTLKSITGDGNFEGRPDVGSVLQPGRYADFEVTYKAFSIQNDDITYSNGSSTVNARLKVDGLNDVGKPSSTCSVVSGRDNCTTDGGTTISITEPAGTVINVDGSKAQEQAAILKQLCSETTSASCTFAPTSETKVDGPEHVLVSETNNGSRDALLTATKSDNVSSTNSVDISATLGGNIAGIVDVSVTAAYGHSWSEGHSFETGVTNTVPAGYYGEITAIAPMIRDTGNFQLVLGNTTYNLTGVHFDTPDPDGAEHFGYHEHPLTQAQKASLPKTVVVNTH